MELPTNRKSMTLLAYLWPLALVPLLLGKDDAEVQWHARNGIGLMVAELVLMFALTLLASIVSLVTLGLGCVLGLFIVCVWIGVFAVYILAVVKGRGGQRLVIPGLSQYASGF
jgi:hypothetical protein